jgi:ribosome-associated protein
VDEPLRVAPGLVIPAAELRWRFDTAGGPGGQHANRSATRAELAFDIAASPSVPEALRIRLLERLGARAPGGVVRLVAAESRSQWRNRQTARHRLAAMLAEALHTPRRRRPTRPSAVSRLRRLADKRHRGEVRRSRRPPDAAGE